MPLALSIQYCIIRLLVVRLFSPIFLVNLKVPIYVHGQTRHIQFKAA